MTTWPARIKESDNIYLTMLLKAQASQARRNRNAGSDAISGRFTAQLFLDAYVSLSLLIINRVGERRLGWGLPSHFIFLKAEKNTKNACQSERMSPKSGGKIRTTAPGNRGEPSLFALFWSGWRKLPAQVDKANYKLA
jgi:hypothetical protein